MAKQYTRVQLEGDQKAYLDQLTETEKEYQASIWYAPDGSTIKLLCGGYDITQLVDAVEWSGSYTDAARQIKFSMVDVDTLYYQPDLNIGMHDMVQFFDGEDELFRGYIVEESYSMGNFTIPFVAMDGGFFLNNNKVSRLIDGETPQDVTRSICDEVGVPVKELMEGEAYERVHDGDSLYDIIMTGYTFNYHNGGKPACVSFDKGALSVVEKGKNVFRYMLEADRDVYGAELKQSSTNAVNRVKIYSEEGIEGGTVSLANAADFPGILQAIYKGDSEAEARAMLQDVELTASIDALGYKDIKTNDAVVLREPSTGLSGLFYVDGDSHTWSNGQHTMKLTLNFQNVMDEHTSGSEESEAAEGDYDEADGDSNQARIWNKCRKFGYSAAMAAAIIGNFQRESGCNPKALQNGVGPGTGLAQWENGSASGRWELLKTWASNNSKDPWTIETQMDWVDHELRQWNASGEYVLKKYGGYSCMSSITGVAEAVAAFYDIYERGANRASDLAKSTPIAQEYYDKWHNQTEVSTSSGKSKYDGTIVWPLSNRGTVTQYYSASHRGWDISSAGGSGAGSNVVAVAAGTVVKAGMAADDWSYGNAVTIQHADNLCTRYAHLYSIKVKAGQKVKQGQILGVEGSTGHSSGTHLHIEFLQSLPFGSLYDPARYLK